jgi:hypothetical protein
VQGALANQIRQLDFRQIPLEFVQVMHKGHAFIEAEIGSIGRP